IEQVRAHQAYAAVDVVADAAGRDHAAFVRIGAADSADAKAVAPVNIRHRQAGMLNAGQVGNVGDLIERLIVANGFDQRIVRVDDSVDAHAGSITLGNAPRGVVDPLERSAICFLTHYSILYEP